jgi:hypothetical protein
MSINEIGTPAPLLIKWWNNQGIGYAISLILIEETDPLLCL